LRYEDARRMLAQVPGRLPDAPAELVPVVLPGPDGSAPQLARFGSSSRRPAAVLILIFPAEDGEAHVVLIERSAGNHRHAGQISLPGGAIDDADRTPVDAALREAREEVGLDPDQAGVLVTGTLPEADVRASGFVVHPVIAFAGRRPELTPDGYEVASIISAPLSAFLPGAPIETVTEQRAGFRLRYGAYRVGRHVVWGATAGILGRLGAYLGALGGW
jgi:8-oxo-dGTP pyrophosphatase MutT (NUDIX family)